MDQKKYVNLTVRPDEFRELHLVHAMFANDGESRKDFYSRVLMAGVAAMKADTNKPQAKGKK